VPVLLKGTHERDGARAQLAQAIHGLLSRRHRVEVLFGPPIWPGADEHRNDVMRRVRAHLEDEPAVPVPYREPVAPAA